MKASSGFADAWIKGTQVPEQFPQCDIERQMHVECKGSPPLLTSLTRGSKDNTLIRYLTGSDVLTAVDPDAATKISQQNQWLKVKASDGTEGYVAAWYVAKA